MFTKRLISRKNFRYIGALDSARTAHVFSGDKNENSWWLPMDSKTWIEHATSAEAMAVQQLILGDIISLSRNQFFDSPAWFNIAEDLMKIEEPTFTITIYPKDLELIPMSFLYDIADSFAKSTFALSAWPTFDIEERKKIGENIRNERNFKTMFKGIELDSSFKVNYEAQRDTLQKVLEYLEKNYKEDIYNCIISRATGPETSMWEKIENDIKAPVFIEKNLTTRYNDSFAHDYLSVINDIKDQAYSLYKKENEDKQEELANKWLNSRTNLYRKIWEYQEHDYKLRDLLRLHFDVRYAEALSESCTAEGRVSKLDCSDTHLNHELRDAHSDLLDSSNDPQGLFEDVDVFFSKPSKTVRFIKNVVDVLNNEEVREKIISIRRDRSFNYLDESYLKDKEIEHIDFMANNISELIVANSGGVRIIWFTYISTSIVANVIASMYFLDALINIGSISMGEFVTRLLIETVGAIGGTAGKKLKNIVIDKLFEGKKRVLTGKVRNWLKKGQTGHGYC